jgi:oxygen-dependent protoporphyrinogen oxidase
MKTRLDEYSPRRPSIVVIGAGVAGLATGYLLRETGLERGIEPELTLLEARLETGGATRTDLVDGYICEWGPNGFLDNEPSTLALVERLGLTNSLIRANPRADRRFIYYRGRMREVPLSPPAFLKSNILPLGAKLRLAFEFFIPPRRDDSDETVDSFGRRRLGDMFATYLLDPMVSGIFAGDSRELSLAAVFPKMAALEKTYGGLFKAMLARNRERRRLDRRSRAGSSTGHARDSRASSSRGTGTGSGAGGPAGPGGKLHTFKNGMGCLTDALAAALKPAVLTSSEVITLETDHDRYIVKTRDRRFEAEAVVIACPAHVAAGIIRDMAPEAAEAAGNIPFAPVSVVCHGHPVSGLNHPLDGFGVLIPRVEGIRSLGCLWSDSIFPGQAPPNFKLLRTMIGGAHDPDIVGLSEEDLHTVAHGDHDRLFGVRAEPVFRRTYVHPRGIAQYTRGHLGRVETLENLERERPGLFFTGASYRGVSVNGCVKDAFRINDLFWDRWRL